MIDEGCDHLHINCIGTGSPTVVIDAGTGDSTGAWSSWVQPVGAGSTRVCTYDRAGMGYSEPGPLPRTAERFAEELHTLLSRADVPGSYVLVGHSLGGLPVRVFASTYAADVAGMVLIKSLSRSSATPTTSAAAAETDHSIADWAVTLPARIGVLRLLAGVIHAVEGLSTEVANYYSVYWVTPRTLQAWLDEGKGTSEAWTKRAPSTVSVRYRSSCCRVIGSWILIRTGRGSKPSSSNCHPAANSCSPTRADTALSLTSRTPPSGPLKRWSSRHARRHSWPHDESNTGCAQTYETSHL